MAAKIGEKSVNQLLEIMKSLKFLDIHWKMALKISVFFFFEFAFFFLSLKSYVIWMNCDVWNALYKCIHSQQQAALNALDYIHTVLTIVSQSPLGALNMLMAASGG